jgi:HlyD family secretion protein
MARARLLLALALSATACAPAGEVDEIVATKGDLLLEVDVTGTLAATRSSPVGPPSSAEGWDFKITRMAPEGAAVKKGGDVLAFDTSELDRELVERTAERDSARKEIERKRHDLELARREGELRVTEAEAAAHKARLKADLPAQYTAAVEMKLARVDLEAAEAELAMAKQRLAHALKLGEAELAYLRDRHARFEARLELITRTKAAMVVKAPIDGVVVYRTTWRGEKKKVGDPCWVGEPCVEVTDLDDLFARGEVDEMESARVAPGQKVRLRLDALPEVEWTGVVTDLRPNVYRQSPRNPLKVIGANIKLDEIDAKRMRPGMQFRGRLAAERVVGALLLPVDAVFARPSGPVAFRKTGSGWERVALELGRRSKTHVEIRRGLKEGDRVARQDVEAEEGAS